MSEDREKNIGEAAPRADEGEDVEAHKVIREAEDKTIGKNIGATEEGPDVEGHRFPPRKNIS